MRILILGEAGEEPWSGGPSSKRLWRWFGVTSHNELKKIATLLNVYERKNERQCSLPHISKISNAIQGADIVFLVGRIAQSLVEEHCQHYFQPLWQESKYVGLPHPSGLNRQLNSLSDEAVRDFIIVTMAHMRSWLTTTTKTKKKEVST